MQKLQCELCGSIDILRTDDGFFQCQHCGCKYTLEQAKSLLGIVAETTIGDTELNRRVENAKAQIKIGQPAEETIESIIKDFPASPNGYLLYFENLLYKVKQVDYIPPKGRAFFDISRYNSLYAIAEDSSEISQHELDKFFENFFKEIYDGLIYGEITEKILKNLPDDSHLIITKAIIIARKNADLLTSHNIGIFDYEGEQYLVWGLRNNWNIRQIKCCIGREWIDTTPLEPLIITNENIDTVVNHIKQTTVDLLTERCICMKCGGKVRKLINDGVNTFQCIYKKCETKYKFGNF